MSMSTPPRKIVETPMLDLAELAERHTGKTVRLSVDSCSSFYGGGPIVDLWISASEAEACVRVVLSVEDAKTLRDRLNSTLEAVGQ